MKHAGLARREDGIAAAAPRRAAGGILGDGLQSISTPNLQSYLQGTPGTGNTGQQALASAELAQRGVASPKATGTAQGYDVGGGIAAPALGGITPAAQAQNPFVRQAMQRYAGVPTEKLQELATAMGNSQQGQIIKSILSQRQTQPSSQMPQQSSQQNSLSPVGASMMSPPTMAARGGSLPRVRAAGIGFMAPSGRVLFMRRSGAGDHAGEWALPGGSIERGETAQEAARREGVEEIGHDYRGRLHPLHKGSNGYTTFGASVSHEFKPKLNDEHTEFQWRHPQEPPGPLHPGLMETLVHLARHERVQKRAPGGQLSSFMMDPPWARQDWRGADSVASGFLGGSTMGRADSIRTQAPGGAYVLPADVVSGLGDGNSLAGARVWDGILHSLPYGTEGFQQHGGRPLPHPQASTAPLSQAKGGGNKGPSGGTVPVLLSHGEVVIEPRDVVRVGRGDLKRGHRILDRFVVAERQKLIKKLKSLPGPVKTK